MRGRTGRGAGRMAEGATTIPSRSNLWRCRDLVWWAVSCEAVKPLLSCRLDAAAVMYGRDVGEAGIVGRSSTIPHDPQGHHWARRWGREGGRHAADVDEGRQVEIGVPRAISISAT